MTNSMAVHSKEEEIMVKVLLVDKSSMIGLGTKPTLKISELEPGMLDRSATKLHKYNLFLILRGKLRGKEAS